MIPFTICLLSYFDAPLLFVGYLNATIVLFVWSLLRRIDGVCHNLQALMSLLIVYYDF